LLQKDKSVFETGMQVKILQNALKNTEDEKQILAKLLEIEKVNFFIIFK
jgi:hypothetical protein